MRIIFLLIACLTMLDIAAKPPKNVEQPKVDTVLQRYLEQLADKTTYAKYLDAVIQKQNLCMTDTNHVFIQTQLDSTAEYPEGVYALLKFLQKNIQYPSLARMYGQEGKVILKFIIDEHGAACNLQFIKFAGFGMDEETIRVFKLIKSWKPGLKDGIPVKTYYFLPVMFKLQ